MQARALRSALLAAAAIVMSAATAGAQNNPLITVDELGRGTLVFPTTGTFPTVGVLAPDPGPGGSQSALTYNLLGPPSLVAGDLFIFEAGTGSLSDMIRFNPAGTGSAGYAASLVFYSALDGELPDALADGAFPTAFYANTFALFEVGPEGGANGAVYTPTANQPGFVQGFNVTYSIRSDVVATPEPASLALLATGLVGTFGAARRRRQPPMSV